MTNEFKTHMLPYPAQWKVFCAFLEGIQDALKEVDYKPDYKQRTTIRDHVMLQLNILYGEE